MRQSLHGATIATPSKANSCGAMRGRSGLERDTSLVRTLGTAVCRITVAIATACFCLSATSVRAEPQEVVDQWPVFRGNSLGTGVARTSLPESLELCWTYRVANGAFDATPAIVDGVVYIGDLDGVFYALDLETGKEKWKAKFKDSGFAASPAVKDGRVYVGDYYGLFVCLDAATGEQNWKFQADAEISSANFYEDAVLFGSQDSRLYSLNAKSGNLNWKFAIDDQIRCSPTVVGGRAFVAGCDGKLHIVDLEKGERIAAVDIFNPTGVTPAVLDDRVYFGTEGGEFFCVNWRNAKMDWTFVDKNAGQSIRSSPAAMPKTLVFGSRSKQIYALHPDTGKLLWQIPSRRGVDSSPIIVGERVFVGTGDGKILGISLADGKIEWQFQAGGGFTGSPAAAQRHLVIANDEGTIYCFGAKGHSGPNDKSEP